MESSFPVDGSGLLFSWPRAHSWVSDPSSPYLPHLSADAAETYDKPSR